ncbi:MAG: SPOR domain-containing protein [Psychromonas sp.]
MASHFQNRLVGISILVASVVIFLPSIIDGKKKAYEDEFIATPIHPKLKVHSLKLDIKSKQDESVQQQTLQVDAEQTIVEEKWHIEEMPQTVTIEKDRAVVAESVIAESVVAKNAVAEKSVTDTLLEKNKQMVAEKAWTIQLGAFQNAANINSLLKTLHKAGFQAHTVPIEVIDGQLTRLFVGPDISREKLEKQLPRLKRLTKLTGKLQHFDAVNP